MNKLAIRRIPYQVRRLSESPSYQTVNRLTASRILHRECKDRWRSQPKGEGSQGVQGSLYSFPGGVQVIQLEDILPDLALSDLTLHAAIC